MHVLSLIFLIFTRSMECSSPSKFGIINPLDPFTTEADRTMTSSSEADADVELTLSDDDDWPTHAPLDTTQAFITVARGPTTPAQQKTTSCVSVINKMTRTTCV